MQSACDLTVQPARVYDTADWDYPPSPTTYYNALLARARSSSPLCPTPSTSSSRPYVTRSPNPPHTLKRRKPLWPKPPHYHASLLRSPLSRRKGLFRAILPPNKAVDFVRWDTFPNPGSFSDQISPACASLRVAECVLEPYEAAAGFFGWRGLGMDVKGKGRSELPRLTDEPDLRREIDEATVDQGRESWARLAEELVGPPGIALRWGKATTTTGMYAREVVQWDPDIGSSPFRPPRPTPATDDKRRLAPSNSTGSASGLASSSKPEFKTDSPSAWCFAHPLPRGPPPYSHSHRFPRTPHIQYGPPPLHFSPYFPGRLAGQGHGDWYSVQPTGASSMNRDSNLVKSHPLHSRSYATPVTPTSVHARHPLSSSLGPDEDELGHDCDKETETDHGYESTTTTTDSDPPPHTPIGAATTSHCVETSQLHGDDEAAICGIDAEHESAALKTCLSDPTTPVKLLPGFSASPSGSLSLPDLTQADRGSSKVAAVFPSLNGSFRQGSFSRVSTSSSQGMSTPTTPAKVTSLSSAEDTSLGSSDEGSSPLGSELFALHDNPAFMLSLSSPPPTSPGSGLRKDSQGFWEPVTPVSPCSSLSSLPVSPSEGKIRPTTGRIGEQSVPANNSESPEASYHIKARQLSPTPRRDTSVDSSLSSTSRPTAFSSPTTTLASASVFGGSYPCSPSPTNSSFLVPPHPTTLLPAFLATTNGKRKRTSRTREIVDQLRSCSIDGGKAVEGLGWLAGPGGGGEQDGMVGKASDEPVGSHVAGQPSPPESRSDLPRSDSGKNHDQVAGSDSNSGGKTTVSETSSPTDSTTKITAARTMTPFPILTASQNPMSDSTVAHRNLSGTPSNKANATVARSPTARSQLLPDTPSVGTSPSVHYSHHSLPSPSHPTVHLQPVLGPPPMLVPAYSPPMYVPCAQYPHQQQGQGAWVTIYPGRPSPIPVHPIPAPVHVTHITGVSGMRHVTW